MFWSLCFFCLLTRGSSMLEKWRIIDCVGFSVIGCKINTLITSYNSIFQVVLSAIALHTFCQYWREYQTDDPLRGIGGKGQSVILYFSPETTIRLSSGE